MVILILGKKPVKYVSDTGYVAHMLLYLYIGRKKVRIVHISMNLETRYEDGYNQNNKRKF